MSRAALVLCALAVGCAPSAPLPASPLADIALVDANPASATFGQPVRPADFRGRVSGWYFGHST